MISAVLHNKAGNWFTDFKKNPQASWRNAIRNKEDGLTSTVFDCLSALSGKTFCEIMVQASGFSQESLQWLETNDETLIFEFWPSLEPGEITPVSQQPKSKSIEPDLLIYDESKQQILIIEAKRYGAEQIESQWRKEIAATKKNFPGAQIYLLGLGGEYHSSIKKQTINGVEFHVCHWSDITRAVWLRYQDNARSVTAAERRTLDRLFSILKWYGHVYFAGMRGKNLHLEGDGTFWHRHWLQQKDISLTTNGKFWRTV